MSHATAPATAPAAVAPMSHAAAPTTATAPAAVDPTSHATAPASVAPMSHATHATAPATAPVAMASMSHVTAPRAVAPMSHATAPWAASVAPMSHATAPAAVPMCHATAPAAVAPMSHATAPATAPAAGAPMSHATAPRAVAPMSLAITAMSHATAPTAGAPMCHATAPAAVAPMPPATVAPQAHAATVPLSHGPAPVAPHAAAPAAVPTSPAAPAPHTGGPAIATPLSSVSPMYAASAAPTFVAPTFHAATPVSGAPAVSHAFPAKPVKSTTFFLHPAAPTATAAPAHTAPPTASGPAVATPNTLIAQPSKPPAPGSPALHPPLYAAGIAHAPVAHARAAVAAVPAAHTPLRGLSTLAHSGSTELAGTPVDTVFQSVWPHASAAADGGDHVQPQQPILQQPNQKVHKMQSFKRGLQDAARGEVELPQLSPEQVDQYKGWWRRYSRSESQLSASSGGGSSENLGSEAMSMDHSTLQHAAAPDEAPHANLRVKLENPQPCPAVATAPAATLQQPAAAPVKLEHPQLCPAVQQPADAPVKLEHPHLCPAVATAIAAPPAAAPCVTQMPPSSPVMCKTEVPAGPLGPSLAPAPRIGIPSTSARAPDVMAGQPNSGTHPAAWKSLQRFLLRNEQCTELNKKWASGSDVRLGMFAQYLATLQNGAGALELEATLRCRKQREEIDRDHGVYVKWPRILAHFDNNLQNAERFIQKRRSEQKGTAGLFMAAWSSLCACHVGLPFACVLSRRTSRDRNDDSETFLLFDEQERSITIKTIDSWCATIFQKYMYPEKHVP